MKIFIVIMMVLLCMTGCGDKYEPEVVTTQPTTKTVTFEVQMSGEAVIAGMIYAEISDPFLTAEYQWYLDGAPLAGAAGDMLVIPYSATGKELKVTATAGGYTAESTPVTVTGAVLDEIPMASLAYDSKLYGRCGIGGSFLSLDFSASGLEMNVNSDGGGMSIDYLAGYDLYVAVFVDGEQVDRPLLASGAGTLTVPLSAGEHNVMILKETEVNTSGQTLHLMSMKLDGTFLEKPADRALYMEFIGDSIACGDGSLGMYTAGEKWTLQDHSGTHGFGYLTARQLDADWSVFARGGIGLMKPAGDYTAGQMFNYVNRYRDPVTLYKPARIPDVVVVELGANDDKNDTAGFVAAYNALLDDIRSMYGPDVKIVWVGKNMNQYNSAQYVMGQRQDPNLYAFQYTYGGSGSAALTTQTAGHPSAAEQQALADALVQYLQKNVIN